MNIWNIKKLPSWFQGSSWSDYKEKNMTEMWFVIQYASILTGPPNSVTEIFLCEICIDNASSYAIEGRQSFYDNLKQEHHI